MANGISEVEILNNTITNITTEKIEDEPDPGMGIVLFESTATVSKNTLVSNEIGIILGNTEIETSLPGDNIFEDNFIDYAYPSEEYFTIKFGTVHPVLNNISLRIEGDDPDSTTSVEVLEEWNIEIQNTNITLPEGTVIDSKDGSQFPAFAINASDVDKELLEASNGIINNSLKFGISDGIGLVFSEPVTIQLNLSDLIENQNETFDIVKSHNETGPWTQTGLIDLNCDVSGDDGACEFQTTEASYFAVGDFEKYSLDISSTSGGSVNEPGEGTFEYVNGTVVDIRAEQNSGYNFEGWTGDIARIEDTGLSSTTVKVLDNYSIAAEFSEEDRGSSGGGGGTLPPSEPEIPSEARSWDSITPGVVESMEIEKSEELGVKRISISVVNEANDVTITVTKQDSRPADVDVNVSGVAYRYMNIDVENLGEDNVDEATVEFDVNRSWVENNNIDPEKVYLSRWTNGGWERLETGKVSEVEDKVTYEARTPGFSYFAVSGEELVEEETPDDEDEDVEDEPIDEEPPEEKRPIWPFALVIVLVVVCIFAYIYRDRFMG